MPVTIEVTTGDITALGVDVVVNAANERLAHGGGVAAAIARAGGSAVQAASDDWVDEHGPVGVGEAAVTTSGNLPGDHVVHVVGPRWSGSDEDRDQLAAAVVAALDASVELDAESVAIPAISAGIFGGPLDETTRVIATTARAWGGSRDEVDLAVTLVGFDDDTATAFTSGLDADPLAGWADSGPTSRRRPRVPDGYGVPDDDRGLQEWSRAERRLAAAETVWLATTRPDGRPHVVPRWGVWLDNHFHYDGAPTTRHVRNLGDNPHVALHLESGTDVVVVQGRSGPTSPPSRWRAVQLAAAFQHKYAHQGYAPAIDAWSGEAAGGLCRLEPVSAMAWASFPTDMTWWDW